MARTRMQGVTRTTRGAGAYPLLTLASWQRLGCFRIVILCADDHSRNSGFGHRVRERGETPTRD
jgi:hypothetical protein